MATTSCWKIKKRLDHTIEYIINPEKTINKDYGKHISTDLEIKDYDFKNEKVEFVSGINCSDYNAYHDMLFTKKQYGKTDGILGFHAYQSFKQGEITADIAHEIGVKLALEMWGDYEVVVATHQNTNHIHNHFVINSVSFKTGKKYNDNHTNKTRLRYISDCLCKEYNLSTIDEKKVFKSVFNHKILSSDYYQMVKEDVDSAISESLVMKQFKQKLIQQGYHCYCRYGVITLWKDGYDKIRLEQAFGSDYSMDSLIRRFEYARQRKYNKPSNSEIYKMYLSTSKKQYKGIYGLYLYYCYLLNVFHKEQPKHYLPYSIRKDVKIMNQISEETRLMATNKIETIEELKDFKTQNNTQLSILKSQRENLWKKYHRAKTNDKKDAIHQEIQELQPKIKELYKINRLCDDIEKRSINIQNNINEIDQVNEREKDNVRE